MKNGSLKSVEQYGRWVDYYLSFDFCLDICWGLSSTSIGLKEQVFFCIAIRQTGAKIFAMSMLQLAVLFYLMPSQN